MVSRRASVRFRLRPSFPLKVVCGADPVFLLVLFLNNYSHELALKIESMNKNVVFTDSVLSASSCRINKGSLISARKTSTQHNKIQTHTTFKEKVINIKHSMRIFGVIPFINLQNDNTTKP